MSAVALSPFRGTPAPPSRNWLFRLLRIGRRGDVQMLVERLFADRDPSAVSASDVSQVLAQAKLSGSGARRVLVDVWAKALAAFLTDDHLTDADSGYLQRLRVPLGVTEAEVRDVERKLIHPRYQKAVQEVLADGRLTELERAALNRFASDLRLPESAQALIYQPAAQAAYDSALRQTMSDERVSASEQTAMTALARQLGIQPSIDGATRVRLDRMALLWRIENGEFPTVPAPIALQRGETCYFTCPGSWHELRTKTVRVNYSGVSTSIRICKVSGSASDRLPRSA